MGDLKAPWRSCKWLRYQLHRNPEAGDPADVIADFPVRKRSPVRKSIIVYIPRNAGAAYSRGSRGGAIERKRLCQMVFSSSALIKNSPRPFPQRDSGIDGTIRRTVASQEARRSRSPRSVVIRLPSRKYGKERGCQILKRVPIQGIARGFPSGNIKRYLPKSSIRTHHAGHASFRSR